MSEKPVNPVNPENNESTTLTEFLKGSDLTEDSLHEIVKEGLAGTDYGEFYQEITETEALTKNDGVYTSTSVGNSSSGFGFRVGKGTNTGYSYSNIFNEKSLRKVIKESRQILNKDKPSTDDNADSSLFFWQLLSDAVSNKYDSLMKTDSSSKEKPKLYSSANPMSDMELVEKVAKIDEIEEHIKSLNLDLDITNIQLSYKSLRKAVHVINADGESLIDDRPKSSLHVAITVEDADGKKGIGQGVIGGAVSCKDVFNQSAYKGAVQKAIKQAQDLMIAEEAPAGVMDVVLSNGWSAVLLHEAVGHGLEGDFNADGISVYSGKVGQQIAAPEVTIIDQGDMVGERGSLHFDDEGTPTQKNVLVENGVLKGYLHDKQTALSMGVESTGNGRRESYMHMPMPRMTNTYFANGQHKPEDIIKSVKNGLYISDMGGGQVDIVSGQFNMVANLAYIIRDGKICEPVKGATLTGKGLEVIESITMVGDDLEIEKAAGMCGKSGQSVTVGCGQPTIRVSNMTVGGTK